jgi:predicted DNA-binding transcriptional regulator YafY
MDRTERFHIIDLQLQNHRSVSMEKLIEVLEVSKATIKRDLEYLRDRLNAPIIWDREARGYRYDGSLEEQSYALPGLWFNSSEIHALLTMEHLLADLQPGLLESHVSPLKTRIKVLLEHGDHSSEEVEKRILIGHIAARAVEPKLFQMLSSALLKRKRLEIYHHNRNQGRKDTREISPLRLVYYRDNWYLESWCHLRNDLRSFGVDAITKAELLDKQAKEIDVKRLDKEFRSGYGIFAGSGTKNAKLRFSPKIAQWVSREQWHFDQDGRFDKDGYYLLTLPYAHEIELIMDILRYGPDVEVLSPKSLKEGVKNQLKAALAQY